MDEKTLARKGIMDLVLYIPGESGDENMVKLSSNENVLGCSPMAQEAMKQAVSSVNEYPDPTSIEIRKELAKLYDLDAGQIVVSNGCDHILSIVAQAFLNEGEEVVAASPTFAAYATNTLILGGKMVQVPLKEHTHDLEAMAAAITEKTKLVYICNPNNPTGTIVTQQQADAFMEKVPKDCIVVFDEAYLEFSEAQDCASGMKYLRQGRNVLVTKTFSKLYGLAGERIGYAMGPTELINILQRVALPFPVGRLAQAGALAALKDQAFVEATLKSNSEARALFYEAFDKMGIEYCPAHGNFIFANLGHPAQEVFERLKQKGYIIRPGHGWGYASWQRITFGTKEQNEGLIEAIKAVLKELEIR